MLQEDMFLANNQQILWIVWVERNRYLGIRTEKPNLVLTLESARDFTLSHLLPTISALCFAKTRKRADVLEVVQL